MSHPLAKIRRDLRLAIAGVTGLALLAGLVQAPAQSDWRKEADERIEKIRKGDFLLQLKDESGAPVPLGSAELKLVRHAFLFGTCVNEGAFWVKDEGARKRYRNFLVEHFNVLTPENAMKWALIETKRGEVKFEAADAMQMFAAKNGIPIRGHCILWGEGQFIQPWLNQLPPDELAAAALAQTTRFTERYKGKLIAIDVVNEILTSDMYGSRLGRIFYPEVFKEARRCDSDVPLFVNEMEVLDSDGRANSVVGLVGELRSGGADVGGIGIQQHNAQRSAGTLTKDENGEALIVRELHPYDIWARLDIVASAGVPIHITEVSSAEHDHERRADGYETLLRACFAHPAVEAFVLWGFWEPYMWRSGGALISGDWTMYPAGKRVFGLWEKEWTTQLKAKANASGQLAFRGFYGDYVVKIPKYGEFTVSFTKKAPKATIQLGKAR